MLGGARVKVGGQFERVASLPPLCDSGLLG